MSPLELIQDPAAMAEMSLAELLLAGLQVALVGMLIVFVLLVILLLAVKSMEKLYNKYSKETNLAVERKKKPEKKPEREKPAQEQKEIKKKGLSAKKVAAIMGAISSFYEGDKKYRILRVEKVDPDSAWKRQAFAKEDHSFSRRGSS